MVQVPAELRRLLEADQAGRSQAWTEFVSLHSRLLVHTARSVTRDHDGAMDAYAHVLDVLQQDDYRRLRTYAPLSGARFTTWLVAVVRRLCLDEVRRRYGQARGAGPANGQMRLVRSRLADLLAENVDVDQLSQSDHAGPESELRSKQLGDAVSGALAQLTPRDRLLLALRYDDGRSAREIAAIMGFPTLFHVYRRLTAVLALLKDALRRRGIDGPTP